MSAADAGHSAHWISECSKCLAIFRDSPETAGVCPRCGHENHYSDEESQWDGETLSTSSASRCEKASRGCPTT
ncbi:hypothetical protein SEA_PAITO_47 [Mycobacterium phage Paito]|uniref:Uncharacterized protein n=1 Tax=Mycobacterium phage Paito TaxID=2315544 RepID=A0A386KH03_9CAUD|nr:DNA-directed RNA polymerase subunit [Mycobacterium phage Paito]AYD84632.1 hypothetical protein SEA_PAITO_47 [Mycobacterium phage Paito]